MYFKWSVLLKGITLFNVKVCSKFVRLRLQLVIVSQFLK